MDKKELINIYSSYQTQINDIWRSLWRRNKTKRTNKTW